MSKLKSVLFFTFLIVSVSSCVPVSEMAYVQSPYGTSPEEMVYQAEPVDNVIRPGDEIYIRISSSDEAPTSFSGEWQRGIQDPTLMSYTLNEEGTIKLPYIGRVNLVDMTLDQASDTIENALSDYLFMPNVYMRFVNTKVTVLGEVNRPGVYVFNEKNINILQALGYANDVAEFGNRQKVLIIRQEGDRRIKQFIDLTDENLLESEWFTLKPDDIVYVRPLSRKRWGMTTVPYNLLLTVISTGIFVYTVLYSN
ncbi:MAG: polysaccharide biosynthesis/export family protein [Bacteroidales bacterium]